MTAPSFAQMKKNRTAIFQEISKTVESLNSGNFKKDERFWYPNVDKAGNGFAIIRFLPAPPGEDHAFVRMFSHSFKGPSGAWYIENSLTTLGEKDPVSEYNSQLWNSTEDDEHPNRKQARAQKRRLSFIANVLVIKDSLNPENDGKVFLFRFGKKIWDKLEAVMDPKFEGEAKFNPFDLWEGANLKLKIRTIGATAGQPGFRNYDESTFDAQTPLFDGDDAKLEALWKSEHGLKEHVARDQFKTYEQLKQKLESVVGASAAPATSAANRPAAYAPPAGKVADAPSPMATTEPATPDGDDDMPDFMKVLAN